MALHFKENREMNKINQLDDFNPRIMALYDERLQTWASRMADTATHHGGASEKNLRTEVVKSRYDRRESPF
jgi:hypothetical protein